MKRLCMMTCLMLVLICINTVSASDTMRISKENLKQIMTDADPVIIDVRIEKHWHKSEHKIKGAFRGNPKDFAAWQDTYPKFKVLVLY